MRTYADHVEAFLVTSGEAEVLLQAPGHSAADAQGYVHLGMRRAGNFVGSISVHYDPTNSHASSLAGSGLLLSPTSSIPTAGLGTRPPGVHTAGVHNAGVHSSPPRQPVHTAAITAPAANSGKQAANGAAQATELQQQVPCTVSAALPAPVPPPRSSPGAAGPAFGSPCAWSFDSVSATAQQLCASGRLRTPWDDGEQVGGSCRDRAGLALRVTLMLLRVKHRCGISFWNCFSNCFWNYLLSH